MMNMKGGVGKSTLAANFGWWAAYHQNLRILMIDLDPQFNLSQYIMGQRGYEKLLDDKVPTIASLFDSSVSGGKIALKNMVRKARDWDDGSCLHIVPASLDGGPQRHFAP